MQYQTEQSSFYLHTDVHHVIICTWYNSRFFVCVFFVYVFNHAC